MESQTETNGADLKKARRRKPAPDVDTNRLPPHSSEAEDGVLGCVFLSPKEVMPKVVTAFKDIGEEVFYDLRNQTIYRQMVAMYEKNQPIDILTVMQRMKDCELLDQIGGIARLNALQDAVPSAANVDYYTDIVREKYVLRKAIHICTDVVARVYDHEGEIDTMMDEVERDILSIRRFQVTSGIPSTQELIHSAMATIEDYVQREGKLMGISTGFIDLDKRTGGLKNGEMIILAARPSVGKTSLAMNIVDHACVDMGLPVGVFSLEMTGESLILRMICSRARVNLRSVTEGFMSDRDYPTITSAAGRINSAPLYIDATGGLTVMQLRARARRMVQEHGIKLLVIDYLQLLKAFIGKKRIDNRQQEISEISSGIKELAKELNIPVIVLSQLSRELEKQKRKPLLADLRESGSLEQDGDLIWLLYPQTDEDDADRDCNRVGVITAKQRNGPTGEDMLTFLKAFTRFENAARVADDDAQTEVQHDLPV